MSHLLLNLHFESVPSTFFFLLCFRCRQDDHPGGRPGETDGVQGTDRAVVRGLPGPQRPAAPAAAAHAGQQRLLGGHH